MRKQYPLFRAPTLYFERESINQSYIMFRLHVKRYPHAITVQLAAFFDGGHWDFVFKFQQRLFQIGGHWLYEVSSICLFQDGITV
jgi:hypothetical protein